MESSLGHSPLLNKAVLDEGEAGYGMVVQEGANMILLYDTHKLVLCT